MKLNPFSTYIVASAVIALTPLVAQEPVAPIVGLAKAAANFVEAYNNKDAQAVALLFTPNGELCGLQGGDRISGREEILAHYVDVFAEEDAPSIALDVESVRIVTDDIAIEDGTAFLTRPEGDAPPAASRYTAVLSREENGEWLVASTRVIKNLSPAATLIGDLADVLVGEWSGSANSVRTELAIGWDSSGMTLIGDILSYTADAPPQRGSLRISWNPRKKALTSWIFDSAGGVVQGVWTPTSEGWLIRAEGMTADGERISVTQRVSADDTETFIWEATDKIVDGELLPDNAIRFVRRPPEPAGD